MSKAYMPSATSFTAPHWRMWPLPKPSAAWKDMRSRSRPDRLYHHSVMCLHYAGNRHGRADGETGHRRRLRNQSWTVPLYGFRKATAAGDRDGFVKLIFDAKTDRLLGAHMMGANVTEMLAEPTLAKALGATAHQIVATVHPHPTMSEAVMEAAEAALGHAVHL